MQNKKGQTIWRWASLAALIVTVVGTNLVGDAGAAQITSRSLTLVNGATDGGSKPGGVVAHAFAFSLPSSTSLGSIKFEYCLTAADTGTNTCTMPTGLITTSATLEAETGVTGFTINNTTNGAPYLTRLAATITPGPVTYRLGAITNPTTKNQTFYVRISTYGTTNATGTVIDSGTVAASTADPIVITGIMPESLVFCTGATVGLTAGVPDCATSTPGNIAFDRLFSPIDTAITTSQMAASTNATSGYNIAVYGTTLTSGSNTISAMSTATAGVRGTSQFGMNLRANTTTTSTPAVGVDVAPASNGTNYRAQPLAGYELVDTFKFANADSIANSSNGSLGGTDAQIYTKSYIVNVPGSQPAGTYTTTLTYICTPTF